MRSILLAALTAGILTTMGAPAVRNSTSYRHDRCGAVTAITRPGQRMVHLIFTADSMFQGASYALDIMEQRGIKASFFLTGNFLRDSLRNAQVINRIIRLGHYLGPHGDRHILLADWDDNRTTLATPDSALADMTANYTELARYGVQRDSATWIVPSFEWYNKSHIDAFAAHGLHPVSPSPGIMTFRDYTTPDMGDYWSSDSIWNQLLERERTHGLDGAMILIHLGTQDIRTDKFYKRLPKLIDTLTARGYIFTKVTD